MPELTEFKVLPYKAQNIYDLVIDVDRYSEFLPWCKKSRVIEKVGDDNLLADLVIHFKAFNEKYRSDVKYYKDGDFYVVESRAIDGPFKNLYSKWVINDETGDGDEVMCNVKFYVSFKFSSFFLEKMIGAIFEKASHKMIASFENRAHELYDKNIDKKFG